MRIWPVILLGLPILATAGVLKEQYIDWGVTATDFPKRFAQWKKGEKWTEDDNFFISRVRPKKRFRNQATQVDTTLDESIDKKLMYWIPINRKATNGLPDGRYDSEVFPMWQYVTHYGNWTTPLIRMPGGFADIAHKNGVPVSVVASVPWGNITDEWREALDSLSRVEPEKLADFLSYYGIDGIGYNSEFNGPPEIVARLAWLHENTLKLLHEKHNNPVAEFIWYDGTNVEGRITFDNGLSGHNAGIWGWGDHVRTSLFFNYNWNFDDLLDMSAHNARMCGRTPLDLYCSINMQGREPHNSNPEIWPLLAKYPLSIGLWGAHEESMFFESRAEKSASPEDRQRTYLDRVEKWFSGGNRNPALTPDFSNGITYGADNDGFFGMAKMMSARSPLCWNLSEEPFITNFNLGNGTFFNWEGRRMHDSEWYNIAVQDYLPSWQWWISRDFLGRDESSNKDLGLKAEYVWDDAWTGGSTIRIDGNADKAFLHLFKTDFKLEDGDEISFRYKILKGDADVHLAFSLNGNEQIPIGKKTMRVAEKGLDSKGDWTQRRFVVGKDIELNGGDELAVIALAFSDAEDLDMRLGELSIVRSKDMNPTVEAPEVEKSSLLHAAYDGLDGKIIFNMPNDKEGEICYNSDVNTSMFKLYAQQKGTEPVLMGLTTSWAGFIPNVKYTPTGLANDSVRFGVSALSLDRNSESPVSWGDYHAVSPLYEVSEEIAFSNDMPFEGEAFTISYVDPLHPASNWRVIDENGRTVASVKGKKELTLKHGLKKAGHYSLEISDHEKGSLETASEPRILSDRIMIMDKSEASDSSRVVRIGGDALGFKSKDTGLNEKEPFTIAFWLNPDTFEDQSVEMLNIRSRRDPWAKNQWGWFWHTLNEDGGTAAYSIRLDNGDILDVKFDNTRLIPRQWNHVAYVFDVDEDGNIVPSFYLNGKRQKATGWSLGGLSFNSEPAGIAPAEKWNEEYVVALGGYLHKSGSVRGVADDFYVGGKALTPQEIKELMQGVTPASAGRLNAFFDFEGEPDAEGLFTAGEDIKVKLGTHRYRDSEVEGQGIFYWTTPPISLR